MWYSSGRVTHICVSKQNIIGSYNGLSPGRRQAIIRTNAGTLLIGALGTNFNEFWYSYIFIQEYAFGNVVWKMAAILSRPLNVKWRIGKMSSYNVGLSVKLLETCSRSNDVLHIIHIQQAHSNVCLAWSRNIFISRSTKLKQQVNHRSPVFWKITKSYLQREARNVCLIFGLCHVSGCTKSAGFIASSTGVSYWCFIYISDVHAGTRLTPKSMNKSIKVPWHVAATQH